MKKESTGLAGFLDGYKARNIAVSASSVTYHFSEMRNSVFGMLASQQAKSAPEDLIEYIHRLSHILATQENTLTVAISFGETLKTIILMAKQADDPSELLREEKMKRLIYHYLEFAELSEDKTVGDLAISIAEMF